jgi:integrase
MASVFKRGGKANRGGYWYVAWIDHAGKRRTKCLKTTDKAAAERIANKLESDTALRREGVIDATLDATSKESQRSIASHLVDYRAKLHAASRTADHIERTCRMIQDYGKWSGFVRVSAVTADSVNHYVAKLKSEGLSARTINGRLTAIKSFFRWLSKRHKLPRDPLDSVVKPNPKTDRKLERRALLREEWPFLLRATESGPVRNGMNAADRATLYRLAIQTGLRSNEIRHLGRRNLFLDAEPTFVTCDAGKSKNRQTARQYIDATLAGQLHARIEALKPGENLFARLPLSQKVAGMLRKDLAAARKSWINDADSPTEAARRERSDFLSAKSHDKKVLDFHALRHTCGAWLALSGVHPKVIQAIMRHSTIVLTMEAYGHLFPGQESDAAAKLALMLDTGDAQRCVQQLRSEAGKASAKPCEGLGDGGRRRNVATFRKLRSRSGVVLVGASVDEGSDEGDAVNLEGIITPGKNAKKAAKQAIPKRRAAQRTAVATGKRTKRSGKPTRAK